MPALSGALGVSVAVFVGASYATAASTGLVVPVGVSVKLELVIVEASIAPEKVALTGALVAAASAPSAGLSAVTVGAPAAAATENVHVTAAGSAVPSAPLTVVSSPAVYVAPAVSAALGVRVAVEEPES